MTLKCTMYLGDCLEVMPTLAQASVNMNFCDLPYAITSCAWDKQIDLNAFWRATQQCSAPRTVTCLTAVQPFTSKLVLSNLIHFRHELSWHRHQGRGFFNAKRAPLRKHENVVVFGLSPITYNPIMSPAKKVINHTGSKPYVGIYGNVAHPGKKMYKLSYPNSILKFDESDLRHDTLNGHVCRRLHPTQKPIALLDWLIRTYSNPGDNVLDPVSGSGTTAVAALACGRNVVCIEKDKGYFDASVERARKHARDNSIDADIEVRR